MVSHDGGKTFQATALTHSSNIAQYVQYSFAIFQNKIYAASNYLLNLWVSSDDGVSFTQSKTNLAVTMYIRSLAVAGNTMYLSAVDGSTDESWPILSSTDGSTFSIYAPGSSATIYPVFNNLYLENEDRTTGQTYIEAVTGNNQVDNLFVAGLGYLWNVVTEGKTAYFLSGGSFYATTDGLNFGKPTMAAGMTATAATTSGSTIWVLGVEGAYANAGNEVPPLLATTTDAQNYTTYRFQQAPIPPIIDNFALPYSDLLSTNTQTLPYISYSVSGATTVALSDGSGTLDSASSGTYSVSSRPKQSTTYTLTATNAVGTTTQSLPFKIASQVILSTLPTVGVLSQSPVAPIQIQIADPSGAVFQPTSIYGCSLSIASGPAGATLAPSYELETNFSNLNGAFSGFTYSTPGIYTLKAACFDAYNNSISVVSPAITVVDPSAYAATVAPNGRLSGTVTLTATNVKVSPGESVASIEYFVASKSSGFNPTPISLGKSTAASSSFALSVNTANQANGDYSLYAAITDHDGNVVNYLGTTDIEIDNFTTTALSSAVGGNGGTAYTDLSPSGSAGLHGLTLGYASVIDNISAVWLGANPNPTTTEEDSETHGTGNASAWQTLSCTGLSQVVVGLNACLSTYQGNLVVSAIQLVCEDFTTLVTSTSAFVGGSRGCGSIPNGIPLSCPTGQVVVGLQGRSGEYNDQLQLICR